MLAGISRYIVFGHPHNTYLYHFLQFLYGGLSIQEDTDRKAKKEQAWKACKDWIQRTPCDWTVAKAILGYPFQKLGELQVDVKVQYINFMVLAMLAEATLDSTEKPSDEDMETYLLMAEAIADDIIANSEQVAARERRTFEALRSQFEARL